MALCNPVPDFNSEEVTSVARSKTDIFGAVEDMAEHLPKEDPGKGDIVILELQMKIKQRFMKISHSQRRPALSVCEGVSFGRSILITVVSRGSSEMFVRENCVGLNNSFEQYISTLYGPNHVVWNGKN